MKNTEIHIPQVVPQEGLTVVKPNELGPKYIYWTPDPYINARIRSEMLNASPRSGKYGAPIPISEDNNQRALIVSQTTAQELMDRSKLG